jgi:hypothetical protein
MLLFISKKDLPDYEDAKKEYDKWGMKFYKLLTLSQESVEYREEDITKEAYEFIKQKYQESLDEAIRNNIKLVIAELHQSC